MTGTIDGAHPWERDNPEARLQHEVSSYKRFLERGGSRSSFVGRQHRRRLGELVNAVKEHRVRTSKVTLDDIAAAEVDVFGEGM